MYDDTPQQDGSWDPTLDELNAELDPDVDRRAGAEPVRDDDDSPIPDVLFDAVNEAAAALSQLAEAIHLVECLPRSSVQPEVRERLHRFRAYHMAELEGKGSDWLGGPYLVDALAELVQPLEELVAPGAD